MDCDLHLRFLEGFFLTGLAVAVILVIRAHILEVYPAGQIYIQEPKSEGEG